MKRNKEIMEKLHSMLEKQQKESKEKKEKHQFMKKLDFNSKVKTSIATELSCEKGIFFDDGIHKISINPKIEKKVIILSKQFKDKQIFQDVFPNVNLEYQINEKGIKENIVIKERQEEYQFPFVFQLENLEMEQKEKEIIFVDCETHKTILKMPELWMIDAKGIESKDVNYILQKENETITMIVLPNKQWLNDKKRKFPVIVDPTLEYDLPQVIEFECYEGTTILNNSENTFSVGKLGSIFNRLKITLDAKSIANSIEEDVNFKCYVKLHYIEGERAASSPGFAIAQLGTDYSTHLIFTEELLNKTEGTLNIDITSCIKTYIDNPVSVNRNVEVYVQLIDTQLKSSVPLYETGTDNPSTTNDYIILTLKDLKGNHQPQVVMEYPSKNVFIENHSIKEFDSKKAGITYLNLFNQIFVHEHEDLSISHNQLNVNVKHIYSPKILTLGLEIYNKEKYLGKGWKTNLHQYIIKNSEYEYPLGSKDIIYLDGFGDEHHFFEKWYYEKDNQKFYVDKNRIFTDGDGKLKFKDVNELREVKFECVSDNEELTFVPGASLSSFHSHMNFEENYNLSIEYADGYRENILLLSEGTVSVPIYYLENGTQKIYQDYSTIIYGDGTNIHHTSGDPMILEKRERKELKFDEQGCYFEYNTYDGIKKIYPIPTMVLASSSDKKLDDIYLNEDIQQIDGQIDQLKSNFISYAKQLREMRENTEMIDYQNELKTLLKIKNLESKVKSARDKIADGNDEQEAYNKASDNLENAQKSMSESIEIKQRTSGYAQLNNNIYDFIKSKVRLLELQERRAVLVEEQKKEVNDLLIDKEGNTLGFDGYGRLVLISDAQENKIIIQYGEKDDENKILSISSDTETLKFNYDSKTGLLQYMIDHQGRRLKFEYTNSILSKIIYPNNDESLFEDNFSVTNPLGHCYDFSVSDLKIKKVIEKIKNTVITKEGIQSGESFLAFQQILVGYNPLLQRVVLDSNIKKEEFYYFDSIGNMIQFEDSETKKVQYRYIENEKILFDMLSNENEALFTQSEKEGTFTFAKGIAPASDMAILKCKFSKMNLDRLDYAEISFEAIIEDNLGTKKFKQKFIEYSHDTVILPICFDHKEIVKLTYKIAFSQNITVSNISLYEAEGEIYQYDVDNHCIQKQSGLSITTYENFVGKNPTRVTYNDGHGFSKISHFAYNGDEKLTLEEDNLGNVKEYTYNGKNLIQEKSFNRKNPSLCTKTIYQYDEKGNLILEENEGNSISQIYDPNTNELIGLAGIHNGQNNPTTFAYAGGLMTTLKNRHNTFNYEYDALGRKTKIDIDGKTLIQQYYFDQEMKMTSNNHQRTIVDTGNGYGIQVIRDMQNRLLKISKGTIDNTSSPTQIIEEDKSEYTYDSKSRVTNVVHNYPSKDLNVTEQYSYDSNDDLVQKLRTGTDDLKVNYTYDNQHRLISEKYTLNDGTISYMANLEYDENDKENICGIQFINGNEVNYEYDALNRISKQTLATSQKEILSYEYEYVIKDENVLGLIQEHQIKVNGKREDVITYSYDNVGNITTIITDIYQNRYHYDTLNRLIREDNEQLGKTTTYQYDAYGNRIRKKEYSFTIKEQLLDCSLIETYQYDQDRLICIQSQTSGSSTTQTITYSNETKYYGYPVQYKGNTLTWNQHKELESFGASLFTYNEQGIRNSKTIDSKITKFILDGTKILASICNNGEELYFHYAVDKLYGFTYNNIEYIYRRNIQGDITHIYKEDGTLVAEYQYDAWGKCTTVDYSNESIGILNPFRYRGYFYDTETQLYYLNSRYYDPKTGRFISPDVLSILDETKGQINGLNLYIYCANNPVMNVDPSGYGWKEFWKGLGLTLLAAATVVAISAAVAVSAGAAALLVGAGINTIGSTIGLAFTGGLIYGGLNILGQGLSKGFHNINIESVAIDTFTGSVFGALSSAGAGLKTFGKIAIATGKIINNTLNELFHGLNEGKTGFDLWKEVGLSLLTSTALQTLFLTATFIPNSSGSSEKINKLFQTKLGKYIKNVKGNPLLLLEWILGGQAIVKMLKGEYS